MAGSGGGRRTALEACRCLAGAIQGCKRGRGGMSPGWWSNKRNGRSPVAYVSRSRLTRFSLRMPRLYLISKCVYLSQQLAREARLTSVTTSPRRWGDILLGCSTGVWGYWLYERRLHRPEGERLADLVRWKLAQRAELAAPKTAANQADQDGWEELERELKLREQDALKAGVKA